MSNLEIVINTITLTVDNTFTGTLLAGLIIAYSGIWLYRKQKKLDIEYARKDKLQDLAVTLLTHINVAVKDYIGQVSVHDGSNPVAKAVFSKMESLSPGFASKDTSARFNKYVANITQALNDLSTPLALAGQSESKVKKLAETIPLLTFLLSTTSTLLELPVETLKELSKQALTHSDKVRIILEGIVKE